MKKLIFPAVLLLVVSSAYTQTNVGIGTTVPETKLHVVDTVNTADGIAGAFINVQNATVFSPIGVMSGLRFRLDGVNSGTNTRFKGGLFFQKTNSFGVGSLLFATNNIADNSNATAIDTRMAITGAGNIGMGTLTPSAKLEVIAGSNSSANSTFMLKNSVGDTLLRMRDNGYMGIGYNGSSYGRPLNVEGSGANFYYDVNTFGGAIFPDINNNLTIWSNNSGPGQNVVLQPSWGQVTIGTYTPAVGYKLSVNGKAIFTEARVQLNASWPDYVFRKNYKLIPLDELERSVQQNRHLPNMPAAAETEKNGIDLGDMNRRLLEKVEELTLYIIDLNKKVAQQNKRISQLEKKRLLHQ